MSPSATPTNDPLAALRGAVGEAAAQAVPAGDASAATVEPPGGGGEGDYATNAAMVLAKAAGEAPREVAGKITESLSGLLGEDLESAEVAGPGFVNLTLSDGWHARALDAVVAAGADWGAGAADPPLRVNVEFVSANPTGPVHVGGTRNAAYGDSLARLLAYTGHDVHREFYVNDAGSQVLMLGESVKARARGEEIPEGGYQGDYIAALADDIPGAADLPVEEVARAAVALMVAAAERSLARMRVVFDDWFHEHTLHEGDPSPVQGSLGVMGDQGRTFEEEGALWLRTTDFGDDKDRVLVKADGELTYFASDTAYYVDKRARGFDVAIYLLGADHHGYVNRLRAVAACAGDDMDANVEVLIGQLVTMMRDGQEIRMSKRAGTIVTLEDLVEEVGVDAARYSLIRYPVDSPLNLDLDLLVQRTNDNPVYYVQYAHARVSSVLRNAADLGIDWRAAGYDPSVLDHEREGDLLRALAEFPAVVASAAELREPHRVPRYLESLATAYHRFYDSCRVLPRGDETVTDQHIARLWLCAATRQVLANGLDLCGVAAPDRM